MRLVYHGSPYWQSILWEGLKANKATGSCAHIWFAGRPEDAAAFGVLLEVEMPEEAGDFEEGAWQGCYHGGDIPAAHIRLAVVAKEETR